MMFDASRALDLDRQQFAIRQLAKNLSAGLIGGALLFMAWVIWGEAHKP